MSLTKITSIVFSKKLAADTADEQKKALLRLRLLSNKLPNLQHGFKLPVEWFHQGDNKPYFGTEALSTGPIADVEVRLIEQLGFDVRVYERSEKSGREYVRITIAPHLALRAADEKKAAIEKLKDYLENRPEIWTGYDDTYPIAEAAEGYLNGQYNLDIPYESEIISGDLTQTEAEEVAQLGFSVKPRSGIAFAM